MKQTQLEALVVAAGDRGIKIDTSCQALKIDYPELIQLISEINRSNAPYRVAVVGKKLFAVIKEEFNQVLENAGLLSKQQMTKPLIETLTIAAYLEPCNKSYIDYIRGVDSWQSINSLQDNGYIEIDRNENRDTDPIIRLTEKALAALGIADSSELEDYERIRGDFLSRLQNLGE